MTRDWPVYINRWRFATEGIQTQSRELEFIYTLIMQLCKPIGFLGYLIICAFFNLWVFRKYLNKYVPVEFVWITFAIFLLRVNFAFTYIDTNRQTLAITSIMLGLYYLIFPPYWAKSKKIQYILSITLAFMAVNIHTSALISIPILFFPYICSKMKEKKYLWIFMGIYLLQFFVDFSSISNFVSKHMMDNDNLTDFSQYAGEIAERSKSIVEQALYATLLFLLIQKFDYFNIKEKPIVLAVIIFISLQGYTMYTMTRVLFYYQVYSIYVIPLLAKKLLTDHKSNKLMVYVFFSILLAYCIFSFERDIVHENFKNWANFKTIFSAPLWI